MNCNQIEERLIEYASGKLTSVDRADMTEHAAGCAECGARLQGFAMVSRVLDEWDTPEISPWFNARLRERIAAEDALGWNWERVVGWLRRPATAAAFAAMLVTGSLAVWQSRPAPAAKSAPTSRTVAVSHQTDEIMPVVEDFDMLANFDVITDLKDKPKSKL